MSRWTKVLEIGQLPEGLGGCVKIGELQIALFHYGPGQWYAVENLCPHKKQNVLSRGMTGDKQGEPKIACPLHKNQFSLVSGHSYNEELDDIKTFPVRIEDGSIFIEV